MTTPGAPDTIVCSTCWTVLSAESHFCSACGSQVSTTITGAQRLPALLSEANLFRMRARWLDAENRCIEALRLDPGNVDGHSLLGDIYRDQGKLEDAAQWYQMALDLNPASVGDKAKLTEVEKQRGKRTIADEGVVKPTSSPVHTGGTQKLMGIPPTMWLQGITAAAVIFVVLVIGIALLINRRGPSPDTIVGPNPAGTSGSPVPQATSPLPSSTQTEKASTSTNPSPSAVIPNSQPAAVPNTDEAQPSEPAESGLPEAPPVVKVVTPGATEYEKSLRSYIVGNGRLNNATLGAITVDPRHPRAHVVVSLNLRGADLGTTRQAALKTAAGIAAAAFAGDSVLSTVTVNARVKMGNDRFLPVFAGDAERQAIESLAESATFEQMLAAFSSYWWDPRHAPPGLPPFTAPGPR